MARATAHFPRFQELTDELHDLVAGHPGLLAIESIGRSHEGREIWLVTATDATTGPPQDKPAQWVDANIHAIELTGSVAALALVRSLAEGFGVDPDVTRALRTRTFYVVPRVNPDGAELALADAPRLLRSSVRPWPWGDGHTPAGLDPQDIDGDGRILTMRVPDPDGAWHVHDAEPRLMVRRAPDEAPGDHCFRLLAEGLVVDHDGFTIPTPGPPSGLDLNRNYPAGWSKEAHGSGDYPGSEPEVRALLAALVARPNVCGFNAYHTAGGVLLRPSSTRPDRELPPLDVWTWARLGRRGTELTSYPVHSVYEDFTWDTSKLMSGASDDWAYEHLGIYGWTTEFWDAIAAATGERAHKGIWVTGPTDEQQLAVLRWADEHHPGQLYVDWRPYEHPQLGPVELGGWDDLVSWSNPPAGALAAEVAPHAAFAVHQVLAAPCLELPLVEARPVAPGVWKVRAGVANTGWLPTTVTARAAKEGLVLPLVAELVVPDGVTVLDPPARRELGQLEGRRSFELDGGSFSDGTPDRALVTWTVRLDAGRPDDVVGPEVGPDVDMIVGIEVRHPRAGRAAATLRLER